MQAEQNLHVKMVDVAATAAEQRKQYTRQKKKQ